MAKTMLRMATLYALLGIGLGIMMASSDDFTNKSLHAHVNLLGWVSMALMGVVYQVFPGMARSPLAKAHVWLHNLGLPLMAVGLYAIMRQWPMAEPIVGTGSIAVTLGFVVFAINAWRNAGAVVEAQPRAPAAQAGVNQPAGRPAATSASA